MSATHVPETRTTFTDILKNVFAPSIITATSTKAKLLRLIETKAGKMDAGGKAFIQPLMFDNMGSTGFRAEDADLPNALPLSFTRASIPVYYGYFSVAVTGPAMATSDKDAFAWAEAWSQEIVGKQRAWAQHKNRIINGDGNAILAQVDGSISSTVVTVDNAYGLSGFNSSDVNGARFATSNMQVDFYTGSSIRDTGAARISSVSTVGAYPSTSAKLTFTAAGDVNEVVDGDYMYVAGAYGNEPPGLRLMIDDGSVATTFQSVNTDTYPEFKSQVGYGATPGTAEGLTTNRMQSLIDDIETQGGSVDWIITSNGVFLTYGEMARSENVITNAKKLDTGWRVLEFDGIPIFKDSYSLDHMYMIDNRCPVILEAKAEGWIESMIGGDIIQQDGDKDRWKAYWGHYYNNAMTNRAWCGKLVDISVIANKY